MRSHWYHLQVTSNVENLKKNQRFSSEGVYNDEWKAFPPLPPAPRSHLIIPNIPAQRAVVFKKQLVNLVELCWYMDLLTLRKLCSLFIQQLYNMRSSTHLFLSHFLSFSSSSLSIYPSLFLLSFPSVFSPLQLSHHFYEPKCPCRKLLQNEKMFSNEDVRKSHECICLLFGAPSCVLRLIKKWR